MDNEFFKRLLSSIVLIPIVIFFIVKGSFIFNFFLLVCFFITSYEWFRMIKKSLLKITGIFFLILSFYSMYKIRNDFDRDFLHLLFVTIVCVSTDLGGYIFGKILGGPKLTKISPKKTYTGSIGSFLLAIILTNIYLNYEDVEFTIEIFIFVLIISIISQLGDIFISYCKRLSKIKDTGKIIPGHGGLLDRVDGMIFAFPFSYIFFLFWTF
ncbi:phosphatidate cytidylyltransferase [Candidatus Pelagibacter sp.]|nr:phosphatidate cytidylyltransferase [Candidatus Pelagibacter sp.]